MLEKAITHEVNEPVDVHRITLRCGCGGNMVCDGMHTFGYPSQYTHECEKCGAVDRLFRSYPRFEYRDKDGKVFDA